jgi:uncharacterized protein (TIGR01777 family)
MMNSDLLWTLIAVQIAMGGFDSIYHHEFTERLAWRPKQRRELMLHGARSWIYAVVFFSLGWLEVHGAWAVVLMALLLAEAAITLVDFVEEDMTRKLPASERIAHTLLALNYGAVLAMLLPVLIDWTRQATAILPAYYGWWSWFAGAAAAGVGVFGLREFSAAFRVGRAVRSDAAPLMDAIAGRRTVLVTGATGFIGTRLTEALVAAGHEVVVLTRSPQKAAALRPPFRLITSLDHIGDTDRIDAIVNLAGEPLANGLWTRAKRKRIVESRVQMTEAVVRMIARLKYKPPVLVTASAVGWYGLRGDEILREHDDGTPCFSRDVCVAAETAAQKARDYETRVVMLRLGLVLGADGGLLARLLFPFEFGLGGRIGSGRQWMSWVARDDAVRLIAHVIATPELRGAVNATAPSPVTNAEFARALGHALRRPALLPLPAWPLRRVLGDFATELLLSGQRVLPYKALASGFSFVHGTLDSALLTMLRSGVPATRPAIRLAA